MSSLFMLCSWMAFQMASLSNWEDICLSIQLSFDVAPRDILLPSLLFYRNVAVVVVLFRSKCWVLGVEVARMQW
ncbi:hypothetical protein FGO68_gene8713 [Halteria grandinella]|uniref:Secreted protein n=1 Tax=Halteria grandinella TaxID=5974 RepID=A0A8J8NA66_HALGN|nr:hypothetical protein FGO68_gene8713 [Halteria grandinella]